MTKKQEALQDLINYGIKHGPDMSMDIRFRLADFLEALQAETNVEALNV